MKNSKLLLILTCIFFNPLFAGLIFGILPCYVLPTIGDIRWCGFKSEPPYFFEQFIVGMLVSMALIGYLIWRLRKGN